ncbi:GSCOCG00003031001-RA-CDS [Cotesia congregata]|nr:GSCOCG00003031001-RA-CDS [Cotesia congregata]
MLNPGGGLELDLEFFNSGKSSLTCKSFVALFKLSIFNSERFLGVVVVVLAETDSSVDLLLAFFLELLLKSLVSFFPLELDLSKLLSLTLLSTKKPLNSPSALLIFFFFFFLELFLAASALSLVFWFQAEAEDIELVEGCCFLARVDFCAGRLGKALQFIGGGEGVFDSSLGAGATLLFMAGFTQVTLVHWPTFVVAV